MIVFVENYRRENAESMMAGGESLPLPYPKISDGDGVYGRHFYRSVRTNLDHAAADGLTTTSLREGIPLQMATEVPRASQNFDRIEIWRKNQVEKAPIVGLTGMSLLGWHLILG